MTKYCPSCKIDKPMSEFYKIGAIKMGVIGDVNLVIRKTNQQIRTSAE